MERPSIELRAMLTELDSMIAKAREQGIELPTEVLTTRDELEAKVAVVENEIEPKLAELAAERTAVVAQVWDAHKEAMATSAKIAMDADEQFARGHDTQAELTRSLADVARSVAQRATRKIVEGEA